MSDKAELAKHYSVRAGEARTIAEGLSTGKCAKQFWEIATEYEELAREADGTANAPKKYMRRRRLLRPRNLEISFCRWGRITTFPTRADSEARAGLRLVGRLWVGLSLPKTTSGHICGEVTRAGREAYEHADPVPFRVGREQLAFDPGRDLFPFRLGPLPRRRRHRLFPRLFGDTKRKARLQR